MSKVMETTGLSSLIARIAGEYREKASIYEISERAFASMFALESTSPGLEVMGSRVSLPIGPAAGPHTQIAPNLVAAWLAGSRVFELKTVQVMDRLEIDKPCILALDEGHNTEWSTELSLEEAREEYLRAWIVINLLSELWSPKPREFFFNMSVGYTLEGIKSERVDAFIEGLRAPASTAFWKAALEEAAAFVASPLFSAAFGPTARTRSEALLAAFPASPIHSVTLSTMHGCPPSEIEAIGRYLIEKKGFDTYVKLNPTLLGYDEARRILDETGWRDIEVRRDTFEHDLQFADAIALVGRLRESAEVQGRRFGIKLSNTLANANDGGRLPGGERYMSGRALFPITIKLAERLALALPDFPRRFSYCGGVSALNAGELIAAGMGPLTVATDILKPGGYLRFLDMARAAVSSLPRATPSGEAQPKRGEGRPDGKRLAALAAASLERPEYRYGFKYHNAYIKGDLPLFDCFAAPCVEACPVGQKVPEYIRLAAEGRKDEALATILADNPLACVTGTLCDHVCQSACSRNDYEGPVAIRAVKLAAAQGASVAAAALPRRTGGTKVAVIGAGPAGLAAAHYLAIEGIQTTVFDRDREAGGVVSNVVPEFRIPRSAISKDIDRIKSLGVEFKLGVEIRDLDDLRKQGYSAFIVGTGAPVARELTLEGSGVRVADALAFLAAARGDDGEFAGVRHVIVAGGGNTAMDAIRRATRIGGIATVSVSYRRAREDMPAEREEVDLAIEEAVAIGTTSPVLDMSLPESLKEGRVVLRRMKAGPKDASGRSAPLPSEETFEVECDLLIAAIGETPDAELLGRYGIAVGKDSKPFGKGVATGVPDVFVAGDALRGPASIIQAEADGRSAAQRVMEAAGLPYRRTRYAAPAADKEALSKRGDLANSLPTSDPGFLRREADRCLACDSSCHRCVEVCPNRAYFIVPPSPGEKSAQILHLDALCNECGNCGSFCPWEGEPWKGKPTLFTAEAQLRGSAKAGFAISGDGNLVVRPVPGGIPTSLALDAWYASEEPADPAFERMLALARTVRRDHPYLLGGAR